MKVDIFKLGRGELVFYPSVVGRVFSVGHFDNPVTLMGTIDLPIEKQKEESVLPVSTVEYERGFVDGINKIRSQVIDQLNTLYTKKKLVTKVVDCDGYIVARLKSTNDLPKEAKNPRIVFEVEE